MISNTLYFIKQDCSKLYDLRETFLKSFSYYSPPAWPFPFRFTGISRKGQILPRSWPLKDCVCIFSTRLLHRRGLGNVPCINKNKRSFRNGSRTRPHSPYASSWYRSRCYRCSITKTIFSCMVLS